MKLLAPEIHNSARQVFVDAGHSVSCEVDNAAECLWVRLNRVDAASLNTMPNLKLIACPCTGIDHIDLAECKRSNIRVLSLRDTDVLPTITATAEHTIGLILALVRKIPCAVESTKRGEWNRLPFMGRELSDMTAAIVGEGRIGRMVCERLRSFGCLVNYGPSDADDDIVSIHVDLNETSRGMCNADFFRSMKPGSYFINTSRGQVVDEAALLSALRDEHLAGAALDVACGEPDSINPDLVAYANEHPDRLILTPHIGGYAAEAIEKAEVGLARKLLEVINGTERR